ncbi:tyrosine-type recombinase/integrase [Streptomyces halstedii]|uniref:tyrosine-type recombinase/integrase n=1 Tax=Streptomyces halstedii TaxID=1944 RepID=UPI0032435D64
MADREEWASAWVETGLVFTQEDGSWLHPGKITDLFEHLVAASGLPPIRLHDLRHGATTLMLAGIDVKIVSDTLGHSDTRNHAGHLPERPAPGRQERGRGHLQTGPASAEGQGGGGRPQGGEGRQEGQGQGEGRAKKKGKRKKPKN